MTCLGLVVISWASFFSKFSRDREALSRLLLSDGNAESTISEGGGLRFFLKEDESLVYFQGVGSSSEGGKGCLQYGGEVVVDLFIESNLSSFLSIYPRSLSLSTTGVGNWGVDPGRITFTLIA